MATYTTHYNWVQPTLSGDPTTWGSEINTSLGAIDGQVWTNDQKISGASGILTYLGPHFLNISRQGSTPAGIEFTNADASNTPRWYIYMDANAEVGNANSNLTIQAYSDAGAYLGVAMQFNRATQRVSIVQTPVGANDIAHKGYVDGQDAANYNNAIAHDNQVSPIGSIIMWGSTNLPSGWTWCVGQHIKYTDAPLLFNVIGGNFFWDGTNFGLPSCNGRVVTGYDGSGWYLGRQDGEYTHQLQISEMPGHDHGFTQTPHSHTYQAANSGHPGLAAGGSFAGSYTGTTDAASANIGFSAQGGWGSHNNMQPSICLAYIIRYA